MLYLALQNDCMVKTIPRESPNPHPPTAKKVPSLEKF